MMVHTTTRSISMMTQRTLIRIIIPADSSLFSDAVSDGGSDVGSDVSSDIVRGHNKVS